MRQFLLKTAAFALVLAGVLFGLELVTTMGLHKIGSEPFVDWNRIRNGEIKEEMVILGSSRAMVHYDPKVLEDSLGIGVYNIGVEGADAFLMEARWNYYFDHHPPPKYAVLNLDITSFRKSPNIFAKLQYMPYLNDTSIYQGLVEKDSSIWKERYLPMYRYHGYPLQVLRGLAALGNIGLGQPNSYKGFVGRELEWTGEFEAFVQEQKDKKVTWPIQDNCLEQIPRLIKRCQAQGTQLVMVYSPEHILNQELSANREEIFEIFEGLANDNRVRFFDYSRHPISRDKQYFYNSQHMNARGAKAFSRHLAGQLRREFGL